MGYPRLIFFLVLVGGLSGCTTQDEFSVQRRSAVQAGVRIQRRQLAAADSLRNLRFALAFAKRADASHQQLAEPSESAQSSERWWGRRELSPSLRDALSGFVANVGDGASAKSSADCRGGCHSRNFAGS